ncbi:BolA/IbaG family iron-sulfur metabolism protein [Buchnera aphidicola]|uniref:BolA/IbaG family iron-sulfur metabolism protein n=1 Tax=Buchnera aphidicola TaxID=9 RepID=UPI00094C4640|nr:BolA/IbaG family iron-sulfur metabolism protein [Buchnera aphidicola]
MNHDKIHSLIKKKLNLKKALVSVKEKNISIIAIGDIFIGMNSLEKQKKIYKILLPYFFKKKIHAVSIQAYTLNEWKKKNSL